ncbi:MAG TPA: sigma-70 family RNA polymerase sigma factor [Thermoanaerobaculia bacterium]|nr:sigma-70 family RNA polymerase sigma factor [Thermoanaerobaculia bacterium]
MNSAATDERELVRSARHGAGDALDELYRRHGNRVFTLCYYTLGSRSAAEDATQSVFLKAFRGLTEFREQSDFRTWLLRIAINYCNDQLRVRRTEYVPLESIMGSDREIASRLSPEEEHQARQSERIIARALRELSPKLRSVAILRYVQELSYEDIAAILGCSKGTVASRLNRALTDLERLLRPLRP